MNPVIVNLFTLCEIIKFCNFESISVSSALLENVSTLKNERQIS